MKTIKITLMALIGLFMVACGGMSAPDISISNLEDLQEVKKLFIDAMGEDTELYAIFLSTDNSEMKKFDSGSVSNREKSLVYLPITGQVIENESTANKEDLQKPLIKLKDWDVTGLLKHKEKLVKMIQAKTDEFIDFKIEDAHINTNANGKMSYIVQLYATKKDNSPTLYGKRVAPKSVYFTFYFVESEDGSIRCSELPE